VADDGRRFVGAELAEGSTASRLTAETAAARHRETFIFGILSAVPLW
jgi:hypothetical protein